MPEAVRTVTRARTVLLPAIVLGELRVGFRLGTRRVENEERLRQFIEVAASISCRYSAAIAISLRPRSPLSMATAASLQRDDLAGAHIGLQIPIPRAVCQLYAARTKFA